MPEQSVNEALTRKLADLARLEISDDEVKVFTVQLEQVLNYVSKLGEVDIRDQGQPSSEVEPMTHPMDYPTLLREDRHVPSPVDAQGKPKSLGPAPEVLYEGFKVPPIL